MDTIVSFGYEDVMIKNVYYTTIGGSVSTLKCLATDDSIRDIIRMVDNNVVEEEGEHEEKVGESIDSEAKAGAKEGDLGNITQEYLVGSKGNIRNAFEKGECSKGHRGNCGELEFESTDGCVDDWSSTDDDEEPLCNSDKDNEELIDVKKRVRFIRRPIERLKVPSGLQTPQVVKYKHVVKMPTPKSTIKKPATRSTPVSKGKKVASSDLTKLRS
ncbi:hypothetical protein SLEP1_g12543 [Rubroshorea leprosula]|uniref:Uncharacterized protein n=1 Tax=Rubroshorea leprosula TaxID=152421 RepID=A0AAV5ILL9_9ROSI|nr:hypothetical protein SLEP1_g12543 [Rubroshorea leprosula]